MKLLVVGGNGREHAICWKINQSPKVSKIYCAPGNAGISKIAECVNIDISNIEGLKTFASQNNIDLTIVGPELPLSLGIVDEFEKLGLKIFGPNFFSSKMESSKIHAKRIMKSLNIPTADFMLFDNPDSAKQLIKFADQPLVIKADGLCGGKGVFVCETKEEACDAVDKIMVKKIFGDAGRFIIVEKKLKGQEMSCMALTDGKHIATIPVIQDFKRLSNTDNRNTGGMGSRGAMFISDELQTEIMDSIMAPLIIGLSKKWEVVYKGVLYVGVMTDQWSKNPKVLEFNVRFGDPECQILMPLLETDLIDIIEAIDQQKLDEIEIKWKDEKAKCVILASNGYPGKYKTGFEIEGLDIEYPTERFSKTHIFHSGTKIDGDKIITNGGRVLSIVTLGQSPQIMMDSNLVINKINFEGKIYREDI